MGSSDPKSEEAGPSAQYKPILLRFPVEFSTATVEAADFDSQIGVLTRQQTGDQPPRRHGNSEFPTAGAIIYREHALSLLLADLEDAEVP